MDAHIVAAMGIPSKQVAKVKRLLDTDPKKAAALLMRVYLEEEFVVQRISRRVGCSDGTIKRWEAKYPELEKAIARAKALWLKELEAL